VDIQGGCGTSDKHGRIQPSASIEPADEEKNSGGENKHAQRVRAGIGGLIIEAGQCEAGEHGEPGRLAVDEPH